MRLALGKKCLVVVENGTYDLAGALSLFWRFNKSVDKLRYCCLQRKEPGVCYYL